MPAFAQAVTPCRGQDLGGILTGGVARCCGLNHRLLGWQASGLRSPKGEAEEAVKFGCRGTRFYLGFNCIAIDFSQSLDLRFLAQLHRYGSARAFPNGVWERGKNPSATLPAPSRLPCLFSTKFILTQKAQSVSASQDDGAFRAGVSEGLSGLFLRIFPPSQALFGNALM